MIINRLESIKINFHSIALYGFYFLMFLYFLMPPGISIILSDSIITIIKIISYLFILAHFIFNKKKFSISIFFIILFNIFLILSTVYNKGQISDVIIHSIIIIAICFTLSVILKNDNKSSIFLIVIRDITLLFFILNIYYFFKFPNGIPDLTIDKSFPFFLYENVNSTIKYILPGMCCSSILDYKNNKIFSISSAIFFFGIVYQVLNIYFTATALIICLFILLWNVCIINNNFFKGYLVYFISIIFIFFLNLFLIISPDIMSFIPSVFGKENNFSGRTILWSNIVNLILKEPITGYGYIDDLKSARLIGNFYGSHNYFLDTFFQRGIFGLFNLMLLIVYPLINSINMKSSKIVDILFGYVIACQLLFMVEPVYTKEFLLLPIIFSLMFIIEYNKN